MPDSIDLSIDAISIAVAKDAPHETRSCVEVTPAGIAGDRHGGKSLRQCSLVDAALAAATATTPGQPVAGEHHENLRVTGLGVAPLKVLDRIQFGEVILEVTSVPGTALAPARRSPAGAQGVFTRILQGGTLEVGQPGQWSRRPLVAQVITLSDRAHAGAYQDRSGPVITAALSAFGEAQDWQLTVETQVLPDDPEALAAALHAARTAGVHVVITTGGTGIGPRDVTPDVVLQLADRTIPGIMEFIRWKHGQHNPRALLSRSVVVVLGTTVVYTLPGSPKAAQEYMDEIVVTLEHLLFTLRGLDTH
jgi:molybdenum cofactor synthesis domain-containing protein